MTVDYKHDAYLRWLACQVALQNLIEKILSIVKSSWGQHLRRESYLEQVLEAVDNLEFVGG